MRLLPILTFTLICFCSIAQSSEEVAIRKVIAKQQDCWNDSNLECFMEGYWKSENLVFIGSKGVTYGWDQTLENYRKSYPSPELMGKLNLELISLKSLGDDFWSVIGKWSLVRRSDNLSGHFTLLFRRFGDEWLIVLDHSS